MYKILIVDDEPLVAKALGRAMARQGFEVALALEPEEALALLDDFAPDVVISDFNMPGMNGLEFLRQVEVRSPYALRIILSGCADPNSPFVAYAASERCRLVWKPWDNKQLAAMLREMLLRRDGGCDAVGAKGTPAGDGL
jgi:two-component system NtrC family sensor kinase